MSSEIIQVLLVEDSPSDAFLAREELALPAMWGSFSVEHLETLAGALERLRERKFDAVVLDLNLPDSDGFETFQRVFAQVRDVAMIVLSGQDDELLAMRAVKAGAQDYVVKGLGGLLPRVVRYSVERTRAQAERRRLEEQFIQAQKMELVGRLSAGLAHDFNNILSVIMGYNDLMLSKLTAGDSMQNYAEEVRHAAERAAGLTRQLLIFSRQETLEPADLDLNEAIRGLEKMLRRLIGEDIDFLLDLDESVGRVHADSGFIGQVIMNLVVNSRDAMPNGGALRIETRNVAIPTEEGIDLDPAMAPGSYVMFSVSDTGCGMSEEVKARIFEAFYTTKEKDQGTGLGLAICQNIIEQSEGFVSVESEPGCGTTFRVYLPLVETGDRRSETALSAVIAGGNETVLVVEDEPAVRHLASTVLEGMGYHVLLASDGEEGVRVAEEHRGAPIRLVLADIVMPRMGGRKMAEWLRGIDPELRIVFTSGYASDADRMAQDAAFLPKPYTPAALTRKVREALNS